MRHHKFPRVWLLAPLLLAVAACQEQATQVKDAEVTPSFTHVEGHHSHWR